MFVLQVNSIQVKITQPRLILNFPCLGDKGNSESTFGLKILT